MLCSHATCQDLRADLPSQKPMASSSKLNFKVDCPNCNKSFAMLCNDESEWATEAKEALQRRVRQHMNAAHDGNMAWPEVAAVLVTCWVGRSSTRARPQHYAI